MEFISTVKLSKGNFPTHKTLLLSQKPDQIIPVELKSKLSR